MHPAFIIGFAGEQAAIRQIDLYKGIGISSKRCSGPIERIAVNSQHPQIAVQAAGFCVTPRIDARFF